MLTRRTFLGALAAPAIIPAASLMPVRTPPLVIPDIDLGLYEGPLATFPAPGTASRFVLYDSSSSAELFTFGHKVSGSDLAKLEL